MGFDPSTIRRPRLTPDKLPDDAPRADKVAALANILHERGVTASLADARRLAEGMVEVERKVLQSTPKKESLDDLRREAQRTPLFDAAGVKPSQPAAGLNLPKPFQEFVQKVAADAPRPQPRPVLQRPSPRKLVFFDEAPPLGQTRGFQGQNHEQRFDPFSAQRSDRPAVVEPPRTETRVEATDEGVVVRKVEETPASQVVQERAVIVEDAAPAGPAHPKPEDPSQPQKIDLFQMFKTK